jgi:cyclin B
LKTVQTEVRDTQRAFLLEWIIDVHRKFKLKPETLYVAQFIIDKYLSREKILNKQLHLLGVTTLLISTKYEEIYPPDLRDFLTVSENKFTKAQVIEMEKQILTALEFQLTAPSPYRFLQRFRQLSPLLDDDEVFFYAQYILEISLLEASFLQFKPSELAAAAQILSCKQLKSAEVWTPEMQELTMYSAQDLAEVVKEVRLFCHEINPKFISILKYKFSKAEYRKVSNYEFKF